LFDKARSNEQGFASLLVRHGCRSPEKKYGNKISFCGNNEIQVWETGNKELIKREILKKLNAAKRGGFIFQSDHSVSSALSGQTYDYIVKLVR